MTPLTWHPPPPQTFSSLPLSSFQSDPQCPFCLTSKGCRTWVGSRRVSHCALSYQKTLGHLEKGGEGDIEGAGRDSCHARRALPIPFQYRPMPSHYQPWGSECSALTSLRWLSGCWVVSWIRICSQDLSLVYEGRPGWMYIHHLAVKFWDLLGYDHAFNTALTLWICRTNSRTRCIIIYFVSLDRRYVMMAYYLTLCFHGVGFKAVCVGVVLSCCYLHTLSNELNFYLIISFIIILLILLMSNVLSYKII